MREGGAHEALGHAPGWSRPMSELSLDHLGAEPSGGDRRRTVPAAAPFLLFGSIGPRQEPPRGKGLMSNTDPDAPAALELVRALLRDGREELVRADGKASSLLAVVGVIVGALLTSVVGRVWSPADFDQHARIAWWLGIAAVGVAACCLVNALLPRFWRSKGAARVTYFADVVRVEKDAKRSARAETAISDLEAAVQSSARDVFAHALQQLRAISWIVSIKYRRIRAAILLLAVAAAFLGIALALHTAHW